MNPLLLLGGLAASLIFLLKGKPGAAPPGEAPPGTAPPGTVPPGTAPPGPPGPGPGGLPTIPAIPGLTANGCIDQNMPPAMATMILQALALITSAAQLDQLAATAAQSGFPKAAACLKAAADKVRGTGGLPTVPLTPPEMPPVMPPIMPPMVPPPATQDRSFMIRYGDRPYGISTYYTGDGMRFKELELENPHLLPFAVTKGVGNYKGWKPGVLILLPMSWQSWTKPIPSTGL